MSALGHEKTKSVSFRLPEDLIEQIQTEAHSVVLQQT